MAKAKNLKNQVEAVTSMHKPKPTIRLSSIELPGIKDVKIGDIKTLDDVKVKVVSLHQPDEFEIKEMGFKKDVVIAKLEITTENIKLK